MTEATTNEINTMNLEPKFLDSLRNMNSQAESIQQQIQFAIGCYLSGAGIDTNTHHVEFDIKAGVMLVKAKD